VVAIAPRVDSRLVAAIERLDNPRISIAELNRMIGLVARELGLLRPSYEEVRRTVHAVREGRQTSSLGRVLLDISFRARPPTALLEALVGDLLPERK
jgi:hypothetical protein